MTYDASNIFAKILRGEIPCTKLYENAYALAFPDISPAAPTHILVIPKGHFVSFSDFMEKASPQEVHGFFKAVEKVAAQVGTEHFRLISNNGAGVGQTVHHFHVHLLAGRKMSHLVAD